MICDIHDNKSTICHPDCVHKAFQLYLNTNTNVSHWDFSPQCSVTSDTWRHYLFVFTVYILYLNFCFCSIGYFEPKNIISFPLITVSYSYLLSRCISIFYFVTFGIFHIFSQLCYNSVLGQNILIVIFWNCLIWTDSLNS